MRLTQLLQDSKVWGEVVSGPPDAPFRPGPPIEWALFYCRRFSDKSDPLRYLLRSLKPPQDSLAANGNHPKFGEEAGDGGRSEAIP